MTWFPEPSLLSRLSRRRVQISLASLLENQTAKIRWSRWWVQERECRSQVLWPECPRDAGKCAHHAPAGCRTDFCRAGGRIRSIVVDVVAAVDGAPLFRR